MPDLPKIENQAALIEKLVDLLQSNYHYEEVRLVLRRSDSDSLRWLNSLIALEQAKRRKRAQWTALPGVLLLIGGVAGIWNPDLPAGYLALSGGVLLVLACLNCLPTRVQKVAWELLMHHEEVESIGGILEGFSGYPRSLQAKAKRNLLQLLPQLTPETFQRLTESQRHSLYELLDPMLSNSDEQNLGLAVLSALQQAGDRSCLGAVYELMSKTTVNLTYVTYAGKPPPNYRVVNNTAKNCLDHLFAHIEARPLEDLPGSIFSMDQRHAETFDYQTHASCLFHLLQRLPQLTPANYRSILSVNRRNDLYWLLTWQPTKHENLYYGRYDLQLEIVRTAERLGDACAVKAFQAVVHDPSSLADRSILTAIQQALPRLESLIPQENESRSLLRGTTAPASHPDELLRAATSDTFATDPNELLRASVPQHTVASENARPDIASATVRDRVRSDEIECRKGSL